MVWSFLILVMAVIAIVTFLHWYSYKHLKNSIVGRQCWDLNICCGRVDGGGINADIIRHADIPNFVKIDNIYALPFKDKEFGTVLCSHTAEHVGDPDRLDRELRRVGSEVVYILPPIWDLAAALNILEHRWIFLSIRKTHSRLPRRVRLPLAHAIQSRVGQRLNA